MRQLIKKLFFYLALIFPLLVLALAIAGLVIHIYALNHIDYDLLSKRLDAYLKSNKGEIRLDYADKLLTWHYEYRIKDGPYKPKSKSYAFDPSENEKLIYVFGSSPLVSKLPFSKDKFFPEILEDKLNHKLNGRKVKVYNFGVESFDSFDLKKLIKPIVSFKKPDLIVYYEGHMDYEAAYLTNIKREFFLIKGNFLRFLLGATLSLKDPQRIDSLQKSAEAADWLIRSTLEPNFLNFLQMTRLVNIPPEPFKKYNQQIEGAYEVNTAEIISFCRQEGVPVILVTPIANLKVKPFGIYALTQKKYIQGLREKDCLRQINYLKAAKETEIFTGDLMAKAALNDYLRGIKQDRVYVLDLENELKAQKFSFDYRYFYDLGHMKPQLHQLIADHLADFITVNINLN